MCHPTPNVGGELASIASDLLKSPQNFPRGIGGVPQIPLSRFLLAGDLPHIFLRPHDIFWGKIFLFYLHFRGTPSPTLNPLTPGWLGLDVTVKRRLTPGPPPVAHPTPAAARSRGTPHPRSGAGRSIATAGELWKRAFGAGENISPTPRTPLFPPPPQI